MNRHLVIMAKAPRMGLAKTRLGAEIGAPEATCAYRRMLSELICRIAPDPRWQSHLALAPSEFLHSSGLPQLQGLRVLPQERGDLGKRMNALLQRLPIGEMVIVGSDIPEIRRRHIREAFATLGSHDAVLGPTEDGGYWLIGMRRRPALLEPFRDVRWSTSHALEDTLANLSGRRVAFLERLADIDNASDWMRYRQRRRISVNFGKNAP